MRMKLRYTLDPVDLVNHKLHVTLEVTSSGDGSQMDFVMPVWTPGSYLVREFARNVRQVTARGGESQELPVTKVAKNRWRVGKGAGETVTFSYVVYGHDLSCEGVDVTPEHVYVNGAPTFCYVEGAQAEPADVVIQPPPGWKVVTELEEVGRNPPRFRARNFDELVDTPIDIGHGTEITFAAHGVPHRLLLCGDGGNFSPHRLEEDVGKIVSATYRLFGELPMDHYTFFYHLGDAWDGGLEHLSSTSIVFPHYTFRPEKDYQHVLSVSCHEYFHLFNVKRIRPEGLGPFDYGRENYTRMLWAMEGLTDYYTYLLLRRSGLHSVKRWASGLGKRLKRYQETPGRNVQSLEEASFDSWIDHYRPYEESRNSSISYYLKGDLVSLCLDLEIRHRSHNDRSLDDVMRHLWREFGKKDRGIPEGGWQKEAEAATDLDLGRFFDRYVRGTDEIDFHQFLRYAGLSLESAEEPDTGEGEPPSVPGYLGVEWVREGDRPKVRVVLEGGPGRRAGLTPGDEILALNNTRVTHETLPEMLARFSPGETVDVTFFRRARLRSLPVTLGKAPPARILVKPVPKPSDLEKAIFEGWLEAAWTDLAGTPSEPKGSA